MRALWKKVALFAGPALLVFGAASAWMDRIPACSAPDGVRVRSFPDEIPQPLLTALADQYGSFARPGEAFNKTDVIRTGLSFRRIIFVWERGPRWVLATEHGGRGYNTPVLVYNLDATGSSVTLLTEANTGVSGFCKTAQEWVSMQD
jgi:hypothetical protein